MALPMLVELIFKEGVPIALHAVLKRRMDRAREILQKRIAKGHLGDIAEDDAAAALFAYLRAAEEGVARRNLEMIADAFTNMAQEPPFAPDEFRRHAKMLADLSREETIILASFLRQLELQRGQQTDATAMASLVWLGVQNELAGDGRFFRNPEVLSQYIAALQRTGLVYPASAFGGLVFVTTPLLETIARLVDFAAAGATDELD